MKKNNNIEVYQESQNSFYFKVKDGKEIYYSQKSYPSYKLALIAAKNTLNYIPKKSNVPAVHTWTGRTWQQV